MKAVLRGEIMNICIYFILLEGFCFLVNKQDEDKQNKDTTQYMLDTTMRKQTHQI
jgi:hypothetical protein